MLAVEVGAGTVAVRQIRKPKVRPGESLLRLLCGGICNTDLELQRGYYGFQGIPGHEFVAEVVESEDTRLVGCRVVGEINAACEQCDWCRRKLQRHCPHRTVLGIVKRPGAFQEYFTLPERNLFRVPSRVATEHAVFIEPLAAACEILDQVRIPRGERVAVLGDGKLGLLIAQTLRLRGCAVHLFGRHASKLSIAAALGVAVYLEPSGEMYRYTVEATGSAEGLAQAVAMTVPRGTLVLKSTVHGKVALDTAPVIVNELTLVGSRCGRFAAAMPLLRSGRLNLDPMISAQYSLAEAPAAFARAATKGTLKVLLRP